MSENTEVKVVLLDIEGTTTSISFVKDILFPYAKEHTLAYLKENWYESATQTIAEELFNTSEFEKYEELHQTEEDHKEPFIEKLSEFVCYLVDKDLKLSPLKQLEGLVWAKGYTDKSLRGHVYSDVPEALKRWQKLGIRIAIYSSGSVKAQQLLFGNTEYGDLLPLIEAHFDTSVGHKQEVQSYKSISKQLNVNSEDVLFLTDIVKEAAAAREAGMKVIVMDRPGNAPLTDDDKSSFTIAKDFDSLKIILK